MYKVYKNLHNGLWSIASIETGLVVGHAELICLENTSFKVSESGRQRVIKEKCKNVHAYIVGDVRYAQGFRSFKNRTIVQTYRKSVGFCNGVHIGYNPYKAGYFVNKVTGDKVENFPFVILGKETVTGYTL